MCDRKLIWDPTLQPSERHLSQEGSGVSRSSIWISPGSLVRAVHGVAVGIGQQFLGGLTSVGQISVRALGDPISTATWPATQQLLTNQLQAVRSSVVQQSSSWRKRNGTSEEINRAVRTGRLLSPRRAFVAELMTAGRHQA